MFLSLRMYIEFVGEFNEMYLDSRTAQNYERNEIYHL